MKKEISKVSNKKDKKSKRILKEVVEKKIIADNVFRLKDERGITNTEFAQLLGFSVSTVCSWEAETRGITSRTLPRIAEIFNVDISELFKDNSYCMKDEDPREVKFKKIRSLLYDFSDNELDLVVDAITSMWKLANADYAIKKKPEKPKKEITYK
ncbi:MAG: helix-turn-helix domain-containing protein [Defluviitaleaceae bacterium]|nr:helix-turn-helix domain-containing protein [Defluviitaleaceae bacterium]